MPDEKTFRRRRAVFLLLVLAAFVLLTGSFVGAFGGAERGFAGVVSPIQEGASKVAKPARDLVNWVGDTFRAKGELEDLRAERDALRTANGQLVGRLSTVVQRTELDRIAATANLERYGPVEARLIAASPSAWYRTIQIDKGTGNGVREGNPVVGPNGLVGRVIRAQGGTAIVRLITDPESGVTAKVVNARRPVGLRGPLRPAKIGAVGDLTLEIAKTSAYDKNDLVYTAGSTSAKFESRFPPDIPVGIVTRIDDENSDTQVVHVRALADLRRLDIVQVLTAPEARVEAETATP
ncbi:MAG: rod shape-determining protein MreC [Solirubrobacteraceae bacterium]|nr:rod shape-determining protein MreC [Solirubrobacteraceae bacterium]